MQIDPKDKIAGFSVLEIRSLFKKSGFGNLDENRVAERLKISVERARKLLQDLKKLGYVEKVKKGSLGFQGWNLTMKGNALCNASAAKPLTRKTADEKIQEFLGRVEMIEANPDYAYRVGTVYIFGSYLQDKARISDIDLAIELKPRESDPEKLRHLRDQQINAALRDGKRFQSFIDQATWPEQEIWKLLKSRSRSLSLHRFDEEMMKFSEHRLLYKFHGEGEKPPRRRR